MLLAGFTISLHHGRSRATWTQRNRMRWHSCGQASSGAGPLLCQPSCILWHVWLSSCKCGGAAPGRNPPAHYVIVLLYTMRSWHLLVVGKPATLSTCAHLRYARRTRCRLHTHNASKLAARS